MLLILIFVVFGHIRLWVVVVGVVVADDVGVSGVVRIFHLGTQGSRYHLPTQ